MHIYCSGIGGIGLSAYASLQKHAGHDVSGSDRSESALTRTLSEAGISVFTDQSGKHINADIDVLVYSEAVPEQAPERTRARELGIRQLSYPAAVGELLQDYEQVIAICGTHGKSSTTAMVTRLLLEAGYDPTVIVGTKVPELQGKNWRQGGKKYFVLEACEYCRSFLNYHPRYVLLTNADGDHYDYYRDHAEYLEAFRAFAGRVPPNGALITHLGDADCRAVTKDLDVPVVDADQQPLIALGTPGRHMQGNAQLALALAERLGIPAEDAKSHVGGFSGTWRRLERKGFLSGTIPVIDDYAHHPREIAASLEALKSAYPESRIVCAFQPHTHDRTLKLYREFTAAFTAADLVLTTNVYDARAHADTAKADMQRFADDIAAASHVEVRHAGPLAELETLVRTTAKAGDLVACLGAGDITQMASRLVSASE